MTIPAALTTRVRIGLLTVSLALGATLLVRSTGCSSGPLSSPVSPSITFDGDGYAVAWTTRESGRTNVWFNRFGDGWGTSKRILATKKLIGTAEITSVADHLVLTANTGPHGLIVVPISHAGKAGQMYKLDETAATICTQPLFDSEHLWVSWASKTPGQYRVAKLGHDKQSFRAIDLASTEGTPSCSMAMGPGGLGFAMTVQRGEQQRLLLIRANRDGDITGHRQIASSGEAIEAIRLSSTAHGWVLLYRVGERLALDVLDRDTTEQRSVPVASEVNPHRVDMTARGKHFALMWSGPAGMTTAMYSLDGAHIDRQVIKRESPSRPRLIRHGDRCAMAWTEMDGVFVWAGWIGGCPEPDSSGSKSPAGASAKLRTFDE